MKTKQTCALVFQLSVAGTIFPAIKAHIDVFLILE